MKKVLFFIAAALSIQAGATVNNDCGDRITATNVTMQPGVMATIPMTLTRQTSANFTNVQFDLTLPEGFHAVLDEYDTYCYEGEGIPTTGRSNTPVVTYSHDFDAPEAFPTYRIVGANLSKTAIEANPCQFINVNLTADADIAAGTYQLKASNLCYVDYNGDGYYTNAEQVICTITIPGTPPSGGDSVAVTDLSTLDYALYTSENKGRQGKQIPLTVNLKNASLLTCWQADLVLPEGLGIANDEYGDPMVEISGDRTSTTRHSLSTNTMPDGSIRILCASQSNKTFADNDGEVATITLNIGSDIADGDYAITFKNLMFVEPDETTYKVGEVVSKILVKNYTLGDVNDDGEINATDLVGIVNFIMGTPNPKNIREAADVNIDGEINATDYVREVNAIMGRVVLEARAKRPMLAAPAAADEENYLYAPEIVLDVPGDIAELGLMMANTDAITCIQTDMILPQGIKVALDEDEEPMIDITGRTTYKKHSFAIEEQASGAQRLMISSSSNKTFSDTDKSKPVATITLESDQNIAPGRYEIKFTNTLLVNPDEVTYRPQDIIVPVYVSITTGVEDLNAAGNGIVDVYNVNGQLVKKAVEQAKATEGLLPGIYIVGDKKVAVK